MKLRYLAKISLIGSLLGLAVTTLVVYHTWQSLRSDLGEIERLITIESRAVELGVAVNHILLFRPGPSVAAGVRREITALLAAIDNLDHYATRPARQHLIEIEQLILAVFSLDESEWRGAGDERLALNVAGTQLGIHQMGLSGALKTILADHYQSVDQSLQTAIRTLAIMALALAGISLFGFALIHRRITGPVLALERAIAKAGAGELGARVPPLGSDELGHLGESFNTMADIRQQHEEKIKSYQAKLRQSLEKLSNLAYKDQLTGLLSRDGFVELLRKFLESSEKVTGFVVALNIVGMRDINETYGYTQGDQLLREIGLRTEEWLGDGGLVGRVGGDEISIYIAGGDANRMDIDGAAESVSALFEEPFRLPGGTIAIEVNFGLVHASKDALGALRRAEIALFSVRRGSGQWQVFSPDMERQTHDRLRITHNLRQALLNNEFALHYQPKVELATGRLIGAEALLRWQHPYLGTQSPAQFIPVAEQSKLIIPIGVWALEEACRQLRQWQSDGYPVVPIAVNVSLVQFLNTDLAGSVQRILQQTHTRADELELEITESVFDQGSGRLMQQIQRLRANGVAVSLDDFGTGYSSLRYIRQYPFTGIKLDLSFVDKITEDSYSRAICEMVIRIGKELNFEVIAEGIETKEQHRILQDLGCLIGQGYYISKPLPAKDFCKLLKNGAILSA